MTLLGDSGRRGRSEAELHEHWPWVSDGGSASTTVAPAEGSSPPGLVESGCATASAVSDLPLRVLLDEGGILALDKPAGVVATGRDDEVSLEAQLARHLGRPAWPLHQLDKDTSGVMLFVTKRSLVPAWQQRLADRRTHKRYLAVVHGSPAWQRTRIAAPLAYDDGLRRVVVRDDGKRALTLARVLDRTAAHALVEVRLETGRTHQVRVHLAHVGHPLVGERRYREPPCHEHARQALHAWRLELADGPTVEAPLPPDLVELLVRLGLSWQRPVYR